MRVRMITMQQGRDAFESAINRACETVTAQGGVVADVKLTSATVGQHVTALALVVYVPGDS